MTTRKRGGWTRPNLRPSQGGKFHNPVGRRQLTTEEIYRKVKIEAWVSSKGWVLEKQPGSDRFLILQRGRPVSRVTWQEIQFLDFAEVQRLIQERYSA